MRHPVVFAPGCLELRSEDRLPATRTHQPFVEYVNQRAVVRLQEVVGRELRAVAAFIGELEVPAAGHNLAVEFRADDTATGDGNVATLAERRLADLHRRRQ